MAEVVFEKSSEEFQIDHPKADSAVDATRAICAHQKVFL
jgi:hypothetical protein